MTHWLIQALQDGLESIEHSELVRRASDHAKIEGEWTPGKIRPSLIAEECRLSRIKKFRGHQAQPGIEGNGAMKSGHPDAATAIHFFRGYMAEGMAVAALSHVSRTYQTWETADRVDAWSNTTRQVSHKGLGLHPFDVMGCSPWTVFEWDAPFEDWNLFSGVPFQAHPDMLINHEGELALVQMKCPSVWAFKRYEDEGNQSIRKRYSPQAVCEMYVARKMGLPVVRNYILVFALEGPLPGSNAAKSGQRVLSLVEPVQWEDGMDRFIEAITEEILEDDARASQGTWPPGYPIGTKWPCDYCLYPRVTDITCEENDRWETPPKASSTPPPFLPAGKLEIPSPPPLPTMAPPMPTPSASRTAATSVPTAPTLPAASSARPATIPPVSPLATSPPALPALTPAKPLGPPPLPES